MTIPATLEALSTKLQRVNWHGRYFSALCPFHQDTEPSLLVFADGAFCLGCNRRATLEQLAKLRTNASFSRFPEQSSVLDWTNMPPAEEIAFDAAQMLRVFVDQAKYLIDRGLTRDRLEMAQVGWYMGWYTFPLFAQNGDFRGLVLRSSPAIQNQTGLRYITPPGQAPLLYVPDWARLQRAKEVVVVYGIIDALYLAELGVPVVTGSLGKRIPSQLLQAVQRPMVVLPDLGEESQAQQLAASLGWFGKGVRQLSYPVGVKDPNGFYPKYVKQLTYQLTEFLSG